MTKSTSSDLLGVFAQTLEQAQEQARTDRQTLDSKEGDLGQAELLLENTKADLEETQKLILELEEKIETRTKSIEQIQADIEVAKSDSSTSELILSLAIGVEKGLLPPMVATTEELEEVQTETQSLRKKRAELQKELVSLSVNFSIKKNENFDSQWIAEEQYQELETIEVKIFEKINQLTEVIEHLTWAEGRETELKTHLDQLSEGLTVATANLNELLNSSEEFKAGILSLTMARLNLGQTEEILGANDSLIEAYYRSLPTADEYKQIEHTPEGKNQAKLEGVYDGSVDNTREENNPLKTAENSLDNVVIEKPKKIEKKAPKNLADETVREPDKQGESNLSITAWLTGCLLTGLGLKSKFSQW